MQTYHVRHGIVLTSICGEYYLVAAKEARPECPYVTRIDESAAFIWRCLGSGMDEQQMEQAVLKEYEVDDPAQVRELIDGFLQQIAERGYLLREEE